MLLRQHKILQRTFCMITLILILICFIVPNTVDAAVLKYGSSGSLVRQVQTRLKNWGYYSASVDGVYGSKTVAAVKYFQSKNGLTADGIIGAATARKLGISLGSTTTSGGGGSTSANSNDAYLIARAVYGEARGEPYEGLVAVAAVILNRVKHPSFPNTIAGVIYQPGAFDAVSDGQINLAPNEQALKAAKDALAGWDPTSGCIYYYNPKTATSKWILSRPIIRRIGEHVFCT